MTNKPDHYRTDDLKPVKPISFGNIAMTVFMAVIAAILLLDAIFNPTPWRTNKKPESAIPWSPHPPK